MKKAVRCLISVIAVFVSAPLWAGPLAEYWSYWDASNESNTTTIDHSAWDSILQRYAVEVPESGVSGFRYADMDRDSRHQLEAYVDWMADIDPRDYPRLEQKAYWMNLYNALSVEAVLEDLNSLESDGMSVDEKSKLWNESRVKVAGEQLSLNDIENRILRPIWKDHRIHFGLNRATRDCPNLTLKAFTAGNIKEQLVASGNRFINQDSGVIYRDGVLSASRLFKDYMGDFADSEKSLKKVFAHYSRDMKALYMLGYRGEINYVSDTRLNMP